MKTSTRGIEFIKSHEALRLDAYTCPGGVLTIGWGHTRNVNPGQRISVRDAEILLAYDVSIAEADVIRHVKKPITQGQFDALVSFVFNLGVGNFSKSTLLKVINKDPNDPGIPAQFQRWISGGGKVLPGLLKRRKDEAEMYMKG